ncbi:hypothetical protein JCM19236_2188 [Vibrio sp. JCM 19236]|nr:hypothetical protein JCM19236_2188 [Vibrio sp. JCM 19236]
MLSATLTTKPQPFSLVLFITSDIDWFKQEKCQMKFGTFHASAE